VLSFFRTAILQDFYTDLEAKCSDLGSESEEDPLEEDTDNYPLADFELLARRRPREDLPYRDSLGGLGDREGDRQYNWSAHIGRYKVSPDTWEQVKSENPAVQVVTVNSPPDLLNREQRMLYDTVVGQYTQELAPTTSNEPLPPQRL
jgi:hypothetical protein